MIWPIGGLGVHDGFRFTPLGADRESAFDFRDEVGLTTHVVLGVRVAPLSRCFQVGCKCRLANLAMTVVIACRLKRD